MCVKRGVGVFESSYVYLTLRRNMNDPISQVYVLEAQASPLPREVYDEIRELWSDSEFGNDNYYYSWTEYDFQAADDKSEGRQEESVYFNGYPAIAAYLRERGIESCLIHYWWWTMYVGNRATISRNHWRKDRAGTEVTILNPNFAHGLYIEVLTDEGEEILIEPENLTVKKNPLDL
jgi:hypothetical protein